MTTRSNPTCLQDNQLPGLPALVDVDFIRPLLERQLVDGPFRIVNCRIESARYRPGASCIVRYVATCQQKNDANPVEHWWYGKCFTDSDFSAACARSNHNGWIKPTAGEAVTVLAKNRALLLAFPNDRRLHALEMLRRDDVLSALLHPHSPGKISPAEKSSARIIRYKPEQRVVARCHLQRSSSSAQDSDETTFLRIFPDDRGVKEFRTMNGLSRWLRRRNEFAIPEPLAWDEGRYALLVGALPGCKLKSKMQAAGARDTFEQTARALAALHGYPAVDTPRRSIDDHLAKAHSVIGALRRLAPPRAARLNEILRHLVAQTPRPRDEAAGFVHGDFHYGQVLVDTNRIGFVDFERSNVGPVLYDIGNLLAACRYHRIEGKWADDGSLASCFLSEYAKASGKRLEARQIAWWTALALLQMGIKPFRRLDPQAHSKVEILVDEVAGLLQTAANGRDAEDALGPSPLIG